MTKHLTLTTLGTLGLALGCSSAPGTAPATAAGGSGGAPPVTGGSNPGAGGSLPGAGAPTYGGVGGAPQVGGAWSSGGASNGGQGQGGVGGASNGGGSGGVSGSGGAPLPPLEECSSKPSVDRLTEWNASGEGVTVPPTGTILVQENGGYVGKVQFVGSEWHVVPVLIANQFGASADLSASAGITLTYSATAELHVQLRSKSHWSGGSQYATTVPSTGGNKETRFFSFDAAGWQSLFGPPVLTYAATLEEGMGLVFVGNSENSVVFYGLRIDGFTPSCP